MPTVQEKWPTGPLKFDSPYYIERPPLEEFAFAEIEQPGSLIRIKAPKKMGKSSLIIRILTHAQALRFHTCEIDFGQTERSCFVDLRSLLRWFCRLSALQLGLSDDLDDWWDEEIGSKVSCTIYFENRLLRQLDRPIVLVLKELDRVLEHPEIAGDFLSMLRFWHEQAQRSPLWQNLRLVMSYSTEVYVPLELEQSPFNVGRPLNLPPFTYAQARELAELYELPLHLDNAWESIINQLVNFVGGHPYLVHTVIAHLQASRPEAAEALIDVLLHPSGPAGEYLRQCYATVRHQPQLQNVLQELVNAPDGLQLPSQLAYQLDSLGIVQFNQGRYHFSCELFRRYFATELSEDVQNYSTQVDLQQENRRLQMLANTDALTQIPNRRAFDLHLNFACQELLRMQQPLTLMLCDIDHFKSYNDSFGHLVGDQCLRQVAIILQESIRADSDFVARYGGEEFAIILPNTDLMAAQQRAEHLREQVSEQTACASTPQVTVSLGVAVALSGNNCTPQALIETADRVLYESKRLGRDRVTVISIL
ncbi:MAG: AAA-like domain-containing protein [Leptolyngbyaceae cyanobacterium]